MLNFNCPQLTLKRIEAGGIIDPEISFKLIPDIEVSPNVIAILFNNSRELMSLLKAITSRLTIFSPE